MIRCACGSRDFDLTWMMPVEVRVNDGQVQYAHLSASNEVPASMRCNKCGDVERSLLNHPWIDQRVLRRLGRLIGLTEGRLFRLWARPMTAEDAARVSADGMLDATVARVETSAA